MYFRESQAQVNSCTLSYNEGNYGGGIRCDGSDITVTETIFRNNFAVASGGGIMFVQCNQPILRQCTFTGNSGIYGGAIACNASHALIDRVTSYHNSGGYGGTLNVEGNSFSKVINSIFWKNSMDTTVLNEILLNNGINMVLVTYSDIFGGDSAVHVVGPGTVQWLEGNLNEDPLFADPDLPDVSLQEGSPCIDAGTGLFLYNSDTLVYISGFYGTAPDMGSQEYQTPVGEPQCVYPGVTLDVSIVAILKEQFLISVNNCEAEDLRLRVFDLQGHLMESSVSWSKTSDGFQMIWNATGYPAGIVLLQIDCLSGSMVKKLLID